jgi:hypothetical protein
MLRDMAELTERTKQSPPGDRKNIESGSRSISFSEHLSWLAGRCHDLTKINIRDLPLSGKLQSDLIQLEHRTPGVGVENGITPYRLSACSMLSSVEVTLVGGLLPLFFQYRTDRG